MNWKQEAEEKLRKYEVRKMALENIPEELRRLDAEYTGIRSQLSNTERGGGRSQEEKLLDNIVRRGELARQLRGARSWCNLVEKGLAALSEEDRLVLQRFYIHPQENAAFRLCEELHLREESSVYRRRNRALEKFTEALYFKARS